LKNKLKVKEIIGLVLGLVLIGLLLPHNEFDELYYKKGVLVKVKWIDGSISKLKKGEWIHY